MRSIVLRMYKDIPTGQKRNKNSSPDAISMSSCFLHVSLFFYKLYQFFIEFVLFVDEKAMTTVFERYKP